MKKDSLKEIYQQIVDDPENKHYKDNNYLPVYSVSKNAKILLVGQAPGKKAQETGITWNDLSGNNLRSWLGVSRSEFYNKSIFA
ncbi:uracil-DNA glycosylase family protein, partial [bacterium]|nr:uracil-DNA glycosylase family protein [bacterium]